MNEKTGIIIQARMVSSRLPGKVMLNLAGRTVLEHVVERCKKVNVDKVIIATSLREEDDKIEQFCKEKGYNYFRGDENDVLNRFYYCAKKFDLNIIVRITSDCPLIDPKIIEKAVEKLKKEDFDYLSLIHMKNRKEFRNFPRGLDVEVIKFEALKKAFIEAINKSDRLHVGIFFRNNMEKYKVGTLDLDKKLRRPDIRACIDYEEDFRVLNLIFSSLGDRIDDFNNVVAFLDKNRDIKTLSEKAENEYKNNLKKEIGSEV